MTLNKVDLPQPEGPMTDMNSPGLTLKETSSTAMIGPSCVSKRTTMSSTTRMASPGCVADAGGILIALAGHHRGHRGSVARFHPYIDDGDAACLHRRNRCGKCGIEIGDCRHRAKAKIGR